MPEAILYSFRRCPYAMRGRMALAASGLAYEHREIILRDKPAVMLAASPKGTVPVFITQDGTVIDESLDVMYYALGHNDPQGWLGGDLDVAKELIATNDGPFKHHLDRYKYASRYSDEAKRGDTDISHRTEAEKIIAGYEERLSNNPYLLGKTQRLADIAIFPFIRQFANTDREWWDSRPYPSTHEWLERHLNAPLFASVMKKFPLWVENAEKVSQ